MTASITFFPVSNGDMTLLRFENGQTFLIDINIRGVADNDDDAAPDVGSDLRDRLERDGERRKYVDAFLLSHPDKDHISGLENHFHLGPPSDWNKDDDKILIREMWSSPVIFRRAEASNPLCEDAEAWAEEARRRVRIFKNDKVAAEGDRILIIGEDENGQTDNIQEIVLKLNEDASACNQRNDGAFSARLLAPLPEKEFGENEDAQSERNASSVVMRFALTGEGAKEQCKYLTGGDAGVVVWRKLWRKHRHDQVEWLEYDILQAPHHCSWRSLSSDSWSDLGEKVKVDPDARSALSHTREGAVTVASCKPVKKDDSNPPHERAKREYVGITDGDEGRFYCTDEFWDKNQHALEFEVKKDGVVRKLAKASAGGLGLGVGATAAQPRHHG